MTAQDGPSTELITDTTRYSRTGHAGNHGPHGSAQEVITANHAPAPAVTSPSLSPMEREGESKHGLPAEVVSHHALYRFYDSDQQLLYVGITMNPTSRWRDHSKVKPWWAHVARIDIQTFNTRNEALAAERNAISNEHPKYNVTHNRPSGIRLVTEPAAEGGPFRVRSGEVVALGLADGKCPVGMVK